MFIIFIIFFKKDKNQISTKNINTEESFNSEKIDTIFKENNSYCFVYTQLTTPDAPYAVEEHIKLEKQGERFFGTKIGNQRGPDMTNGYTGTIVGIKESDQLKLVFDYNIEGSKNKELEIYEIKGNNLIKKRYPLSEGEYQGKKMLVPNNTDEPEFLDYKKEQCE